MVHLQSWFWVHPLLQKLHQFSRIVGLRTHYCTPVGELVRCVPAAKESLSNILHWETAVAVIRNSFGNPAVYVGPNHHSSFSLERELDVLLHTRDHTEQNWLQMLTLQVVQGVTGPICKWNAASSAWKVMVKLKQRKIISTSAAVNIFAHYMIAINYLTKYYLGRNGFPALVHLSQYL